MPVNAAKIYSVLGSQTSLVPLVVKDSFSSFGMTAGSYVTGKEEGLDRCIDEIGTEVIWLGGIPAYKWLFDKTAFKATGLDSKFDARNLKNREIFEKTKKYAPTEDIKKSIEKIDSKQGLFKKMAASKFLVSTALSIITYIMLTKFKQNYTEKQIKKHLIHEYQNKNKEKQKETNNLNQETDNTQKSPSFKSLSSFTEGLAYNSVKNMWVMDGAITTERLLDARSPQECAGYAIKEAFALCFLYYAGGKVQELLEKNATKKYNRNIALDARVLEDSYLKQIFADDSIKKSFEEFDKIKSISNGNKISKDPLALYDFLHANPENAIVKVAKKSDVISSYKNTNKIDTRFYIDLEKVEDISKNLKELYGQYKTSIEKGCSAEKFFNSLKKHKRYSILMNIGVSVFALGVLAPATMLFKRKFYDKESEFQTKKDIREKLIKEGIIA